MALSNSQRDREFVNFKDNGDGTTSRYSDIASGFGGFLVDQNGRRIEFDLITASYPDSITETYTYSLSATDVLTITVTYTDSTKELISTVSRSYP